MKLVNYFADGGSLPYGSDKELFQSILGEFNCIPDHHVNTRRNSLVSEIDDILLNSEFHKVLTFLEILLRQMSNDPRSNPRMIDKFYKLRNSLEKKIQELFVKHGASYRLVINWGNPFWFYPCDSD